jgi:hypothetical protein
VIEALAITDRPPHAAPLPEGLALAGTGPVAGVYRAVTQRPSPSGAEDLWRHDSLLEELMAERAVLPLRYGTVLDGEEELERILAERSAEFARLLERVRGRVELAVRVLADEEDRPDATAGGGEYMRKLARRRARADRAATLLEPLEEVAEASVARDSAEEAWTRRAYLVERGRLGEFRRRLDELTESSPELRVTCTGPWAPYSFVSEEAT